jgi:hypothetical protein
VISLRVLCVHKFICLYVFLYTCLHVTHTSENLDNDRVKVFLIFCASNTRSSCHTETWTRLTERIGVPRLFDSSVRETIFFVFSLTWATIEWRPFLRTQAQHEACTHSWSKMVPRMTQRRFMSHVTCRHMTREEWNNATFTVNEDVRFFSSRKN